ncbi:hypothetical protein [Clostridium chrysemydis]|uniref:hypothetical protein n=1 Tax=Clostridium chrysemydis TaxID=2665504 RepID=UPI00188343FA|nr:hypothetical protein [Clostridium chrysemydis]
MSKQDVTLGSGDLYIKKFTGEIPADDVIEVEENKIGGISGGASVSYKPTLETVADDKGFVWRVFIKDTEVIFKSGVLSWNLDVLNKLALAGEITTIENKKRRLVLGQRGAIDSHLIRFVHTKGDGSKFRVTIVGTCQNGFELVFDAEKATVIDAEFVAGSLDQNGTKLILEEDIVEVGGR